LRRSYGIRKVEEENEDFNGGPLIEEVLHGDSASVKSFPRENEANQVG